MQHLVELLRAKRLDVDKILSSKMDITIKLDGTALQYCNGGFYKRPYRPDQPLETKKIGEIDFMLNTYYSKAVIFLANALKNIDTDGLVLNFEVFSSKEHHSIVYKKSFKHDCVLLSAYKDGVQCDRTYIEDIAKKLDISSVPYILNDGYLKDLNIDIKTLRDLTDMPRELYEYVVGKFKSKIENVSEDEIEGFVFSIYDESLDKIRMYKLNNPDFMDVLMNNLQEQRLFKADYSKTLNMMMDKLEPLEYIKSLKNYEDCTSPELITSYFDHCLYSAMRDEERSELFKVFKEELEETPIKKFTFNISYFKEKYGEYYYKQLVKKPIYQDLLFICMLLFSRKHKSSNLCDEQTLNKINKVAIFIEKNSLSN